MNDVVIVNPKTTGTGEFDQSFRPKQPAGPTGCSRIPRLSSNKVGRHYRGYYHDHCFLPLYVFCEDQLLVGYLRLSNRGAARHTWGILALLVKRLRQQWPDVEILFRGDAGFCCHDIMT